MGQVGMCGAGCGADSPLLPPNRFEPPLRAVRNHNMNPKETTEVADRNQRKVFLPRKLVEFLPHSSALPNERLRWNTNEEIASYLITFEKHDEWLSCTPRTRPRNGSLLLYNRKKVKYRKDGYCWKKRRDGKTTREDHMKLKVQGVECLYGCYVHSSIVPTFHRRCYWLLQNPDIVLVHYLNVPSMEEGGLGVSVQPWLGWPRTWTAWIDPPPLQPHTAPPHSPPLTAALPSTPLPPPPPPPPSPPIPLPTPTPPLTPPTPPRPPRPPPFVRPRPGPSSLTPMGRWRATLLC